LGKLFCHIDIPNDYDPRLEDIPDYIVTHFQGSLTGNPIVYIVDPYLDPLNMLYEQIRSRRFDSKLYVKTLKSLHDINQGIEFKVITDFDIEPLKEQLPKDGTPYNYAKFFISGASGKVEVVKYPSKTGKFPNVLHDRWFILKGRDSFFGLHFGPSLDDYTGKDVTVTEFDSISATETGIRFENIWKILTGWLK